MSYNLESLSNDCSAAIKADNGTAGREQVRDCIARACADDDFVSQHLGPNADKERDILYEDPQFGFCIIAHVYKGPKSSNPHDHGPSWAIYGQAVGETVMTDWKVLSRPTDDEPGKVEASREYTMTRGDAYLYDVGHVHSPARADTTKLLRVEGTDMTKVKRKPYVAA
jgi:predicted metal-dependent enzyme (double-stranded beta helix superfamily)